MDEINRRRGYTVHVTDEICAELRIAGVSAVRADSGEAVRRLVDADLVTTAVGLGVLPRVAPVIAAGLRARKAAGVAAPLNVVACENGVRATSRLKASVYEALDAPTAAWAERTVGFADCSVDRIVPPVAFPEPLDVAAEAFHEWNVERSAWVGEPPQLSGMHLTDELEAHIERKLFTLNTGHCATAYLGHLKGYVTIAEALADERIFGLVRGAMRQSGEALIRKFGFGRAQHAAYIDSVLRRFRNPWLRDTVARVGARSRPQALRTALFLLSDHAGGGLRACRGQAGARGRRSAAFRRSGRRAVCRDQGRRSPGSVCRLPCGGLPASTTTGSWRRWSTLMRGCRRPSGRDGRSHVIFRNEYNR